MLLQYIGLIVITKEFDKVALLSATADDIKHYDYPAFMITQLLIHMLMRDIIETSILISLYQILLNNELR